MSPPAGNPGQRYGGEVDGEGFTQVKNRQRNIRGGPSKTKEPETKTPRSNNPFDVLGEKMVEGDTSRKKMKR